MHEYSLMEGIIEAVVGQLNQQGITAPGKVLEMHLTVGALDIHSLESFEQAFAIQIQGTPLEGARVTVNVIPAELECEECGYSGPVGEDEADGHDAIPVAQCPRCGRVVAVRGGRGVTSIELVLDENEIEEELPPAP